MKKLYALLMLVGLCHFAFSQASRLVLVEEFTQASCPPCAAQNPDFDALILSQPQTVVTLKYHTDWPGVDEMNAQNPDDVQTRVTYYSINGVPMGAMDGFVWPDYDGYTSSADQYKGAPYQCTQALIDSMAAITSPLNLTVTHWFSSDYDSIYATVTIDAVNSFSGSLVAQVAVIEKEVAFDTPPGTNGETEFDAVMKKMLPNAGGTALASSWSANDEYSFTVGWKLSNIYDLNQLGVVAFIQNNTGKAILQSAYSAPQTLANVGVVTSLSSSSVITCDGNITPSVIIKNTGTATMTSGIITVSVDNVATSTYNWSGSLTTNQSSAAVTLPTLNLTGGGHTITAVISDVNGTTINAGVFSPQISVIAEGAPALTPVVEGFTSSTFPPANWGINNPDGDDTWSRVTTTGGFQVTPYNSVKYPFYIIGPDLYDEMFAVNFDLSDNSQTQANLQFDIAKAKYNSTYNDELDILASTDCGANWSTIYTKTDATGLSTATSTSDWKPTSASQWRTDIVDISNLLGNSNVIVKFKAISGYGNNLYIDNVNIHYGVETGISNPNYAGQISVFPNPADEMTTVQIGASIPSDSKIEFANLLGQTVFAGTVKTGSYQVNTSGWENGMYIVRLVANNGQVLMQDKINVTH